MIAFLSRNGCERRSHFVLYTLFRIFMTVYRNCKSREIFACRESFTPNSPEVCHYFIVPNLWNKVCRNKVAPNEVSSVCNSDNICGNEIELYSATFCFTVYMSYTNDQFLSDSPILGDPYTYIPIGMKYDNGFLQPQISTNQTCNLYPSVYGAGRQLAPSMLTNVPKMVQNDGPSSVRHLPLEDKPNITHDDAIVGILQTFSPSEQMMLIFSFIILIILVKILTALDHLRNEFIIFQFANKT